MYTRSWHVIKDETTRTFEVVGQESNDNAFSNKTIAMQRDGMNISTVILPVGNKYSSKDSIRLSGYTREDGLYKRLFLQHQNIIRQQAGAWDD